MLPLIANPAKAKAKVSASAKSWGLFIFSFLLSGAFGFFLKQFLTIDGWLWLVGLFAILFLAVFHLLVVLTRQYASIVLFAFLDAAVAGAFFYSPFSIPIIAAVFALFLFLLWGSGMGRMEIDSLLKVRFGRVAKEVISKAVWGLAILFSVVYFLKMDAHLKKGGDYFLSQTGFNQLIAPSIPVIKSFIPDFDPSLSVYNFAQKVAEKEISENEEAQQLSDPMKQSLASQAASDLAARFTPYFGEGYNQNELIQNLAYNSIMQRIYGLPDATKTFIAIAMSILVFFGIIAFTFVFRMVAAFLAWLICEIFILAGFARRTTETRSQEVIVLD